MKLKHLQVCDLFSGVLHETRASVGLWNSVQEKMGMLLKIEN